MTEKYVCWNCGWKQSHYAVKCPKCKFLQGKDFPEKMAEIMRRAEREMGKLFKYFPQEKLEKYLFQLSNNHIKNYKEKMI